MELQELYTVFVMGFFTSLSHCIGMCGGFIMAYTVTINRQKNSQNIIILPHFLYHGGRVITYVALGAVFGLVGSTTRLALGILNLQNLLFVLAGLVMIIVGFELLGIFPSGSYPKMPFLNRYQAFIRKSIQKVNTHNVFLLGLMLGFIPCGPVYVAGAAAVASGTVFTGMLTMASFGLGTFPILLLFGFSTNFLTVKFRNTLLKVTAILVIIFGCLTMYKGVQKWLNHSPQHVECCGEPSANP